MYLRLCLCIYMYTHIGVYIEMCSPKCVHTCTYTQKYVYIKIVIYIYIDMYVCIYTYVYTHVYSYTLHPSPQKPGAGGACLDRAAGSLQG